jgi:serine/threonine-protein kinase
VPDVLRLREDWARNVLEASGFTVISDTLESELPRGRVAEIIPEPGTDVALPMEVQLLVSTGPAQIKMPLILGMEQAEAEALIDSVGLVMMGVETRFRFGRDQGRVVEQEPPADSLLDPGSPVRIVVGRRARGRGR